MVDLSDTYIEVTSGSRSDWRNTVGAAPPLMGHQNDAVANAVRELQKERASGVVCVPTGGGKTRIGAEVAVGFIARSGFRVLWLAHKNDLIDQAVEAFVRVAAAQEGRLRIGRFQSGAKKVRRDVDVVVASINTINRGDNISKLLLPDQRFDLVVVDECHHTVARTWRKLVERLREDSPGGRLLGLSATPFRQDEDEDRVLRSIFSNKPIYEVGATELIGRRVLSKPVFFEVDTQEVLAFAGGFFDEEANDDFSTSQLAQIADRQARNRLMVDVYLSDRRSWGPTLFFACTVKHCEQIAAMQRANGVKRAMAVHGEMALGKRRKIIDDYKGGQIDVLVSAMLLTEGTDLPTTQSLFMARPTRSRILFRQMIGRGLRGPLVKKGTVTCNILLFRDTFSEHAAEGIADGLAWLAGLADEDLALRRLEQKEVDAKLTAARQDDPLLAAERTRRRAALEERVGALVGDSGIVGETTERRLEGWWELEAAPDCPALVLPCFKGFPGIRRAVERACDEIRKGRASAGNDLYHALQNDAGAHMIWQLYVRTDAFLSTARRLALVPVWVDIDHADVFEERAFVRENPTLGFDESYRQAGQRLIRFEAEDVVRRFVLSCNASRVPPNWSCEDSDLWTAHLTKSERWKRLVLRSGDFFLPREWRDVAAKMRGLLVAGRPDDA